MKGSGLKIVCVLLVCVAMLGCRPRGVLSNREMREVLYDLHRADGAIQVAGYYKNVLDKHGITQAEFDSSLVWFTDNPQIFNKIYPKVIARLETDLEVEKQIRDAAREKRKTKKESTPQRQLRDLEEVKKEMRNGLGNPWKEWKVEEFCEKDVIIFGQLGAGDALALSEP